MLTKADRLLARYLSDNAANNSERMFVSCLNTATYRMAKRLVLAFAFIFAANFFVRAQEHTMRVYYPYDDATLMRSYMNNSQIFDEIDEIIASDGDVVPCFEIISYSSPEGDWNYNLRLSRRRANSLKRYLESRYPQLVGNITINPNAESWEELHKLVSSDNRLSNANRSDIIRIIESDKAPDVKERELKSMECYRTFYRNFFRGLRYAQISVVGETPMVAASGTDGEESADVNVATDSSSTVISGVSDNVVNSVNTTETAEPASNDKTAVSGSAATASTSTAAAQEGTATSVAGVPVVYFLYNEDFIRPDFKNNQANLQEIVRRIAAGEITEFTIAGFSSPEGSVRLNESLSYRRAMAFKNYIVNLFPELENKITIVNGGENWSALREQVENGTALSESEKEEVLSIIDSNDDPQTKEVRLKRTTAYRKIARKYFPNIRCASFVNTRPSDTTQTRPVVDDNPNAPQDVIPQVDTVATQIDTTGLTDLTDIQVDTTNFAQIDTTATQIDTLGHKPTTTVEEQTGRYPIVAVSTNLLYDAVIAPNFAIEVPIGKKWSVYGEYTFPWWLAKGNEWCYEMLKWDIGARYRISNNYDKNDPLDILTGHFVGVDLSAGYYDFEPLHNGYQGEFQMASLEYGYAWNLGNNWRLDAVVGAGWMGTHYRYYEADPTDQHLIYQYSGKLNWFGPTKAGVSIKYIFTANRRSGK